MSAELLLHASLLACTAYFLCMGAAHFVGFKVPIRFVYWNVPSNHYQDMIISFCALTYALLFAGAATIPATVPVALLALAGLAPQRPAFEGSRGGSRYAARTSSLTSTISSL